MEDNAQPPILGTVQPSSQRQAMAGQDSRSNISALGHTYAYGLGTYTWAPVGAHTRQLMSLALTGIARGGETGQEGTERRQAQAHARNKHVLTGQLLPEG